MIWDKHFWSPLHYSLIYKHKNRRVVSIDDANLKHPPQWKSSSASSKWAEEVAQLTCTQTDLLWWNSHQLLVQILNMPLLNNFKQVEGISVSTTGGAGRIQPFPLPSPAQTPQTPGVSPPTEDHFQGAVGKLTALFHPYLSIPPVIYKNKQHHHCSIFNSVANNTLFYVWNTFYRIEPGCRRPCLCTAFSLLRSQQILPSSTSLSHLTECCCSKRSPDIWTAGKGGNWRVGWGPAARGRFEKHRANAAHIRKGSLGFSLEMWRPGNKTEVGNGASSLFCFFQNEEKCHFPLPTLALISKPHLQN